MFWLAFVFFFKQLLWVPYLMGSRAPHILGPTCVYFKMTSLENLLFQGRLLKMSVFVNRVPDAVTYKARLSKILRPKRIQLSPIMSHHIYTHHHLSNLDLIFFLSSLSPPSSCQDLPPPSGRLLPPWRPPSLPPPTPMRLHLLLHIPVAKAGAAARCELARRRLARQRCLEQDGAAAQSCASWASTWSYVGGTG